MSLRAVVRDCQVFWKSLILVLTPLLLLFVPLGFGDNHSEEMWCLYVVLIMAVWWTVEALPLAVTAFVPIFAFPLVGVLGVKEVCMQYLKDTNFLFFGGLVVAVAVEESGLHKRIALRVLVSVGSKPRWLLLGFMAVTAFLSMWLSNTATTAMMVPIAVAVLEEMVITQRRHTASSARLPVPESTAASTATQLSVLGTRSQDALAANAQARQSLQQLHERDPEAPLSAADLGLHAPEGLSFVASGSLSAEEARVAKAILLSICVAANIGGTGTLTGTGPNLVLRNSLSDLAKGQETGLSFGSWMPFGVCSMLLCLLLAWLWLQLAFLRRKALTCASGDAASEAQVNAMLRRQYEGLGRISFAEASVLFWFLVLVLLWIFRKPSGIRGWQDAFAKGAYFSDASPAMLVSLILFAWPNQLPDFLCLREDKARAAERRGSLMSWGAMKRRFPWSVIMLLGGGFALATAVKKSGLSQLLADGLGGALSGLSSAGVAAVFAVLVTFVTEVSSNSATASIFLPVLGDLAVKLCVNPLYFMLPATLACSFAFMLPVSTPPNAIVYEVGVVPIPDMVATGLVLNLLCIVASLGVLNSAGVALFDLHAFPHWANASSSLCNVTRTL